MKTDMKQIVILVASLAVGILAFAATQLHLKNQLAQIMAQKKQDDMREVIVAARPLGRGYRLRDQDLRRHPVRAETVGSLGFSEAEARTLIGKELTVRVESGQPILQPFLDATSTRGSSLAYDLDKSVRAVSLSIGGASAVSGLIRPNDRVDLLGTFAMPSKENPEIMEVTTMTILQNVLVLAVGTETSKSRVASGSRSAMRGYSTVTLEVTPEEAELLVFAEYTKGQITLTLRNPEAMRNYLEFGADGELKAVNFDDLKFKIPKYHEERKKNIGEKKWKSIH
jgi:pilus assembly protein CpaB